MAYLKIIKATKEFTNKLLNVNLNFKSIIKDAFLNIKNNNDLVRYVLETNKKNDNSSVFYLVLDNDNFYKNAIALIEINCLNIFKFKITFNEEYSNINFEKNILMSILKFANERFEKNQIYWLNNLNEHKLNYFEKFFNFEIKQDGILINSKKDSFDLIDIHFHPFKEYYNNPTNEINASFKNGLKKIFFVSCSWSEIKEIQNEYMKHKNLFPVYGIHPSSVKNDDDYKILEKAINKDVVAIGEIGLDYHHEKNPDKKIQISSFKKQINVAKKFNLPVILHVREAFEDVYKIITNREYENIKFIFHTYSGNIEWTKKLINHPNFYFSFSGVITYKKNSQTRELIRLISSDKLFSETDAPYLPPENYRGKKNHSYYVKYVVETLALIKNIEYTEMLKIIENNVKKVFGV
ncbi:TatD family hydrolase [[Mycoplasma] collis]|uniref:TatD family hydrolase n=1 Tax=[Mycoplasma] collis TaxID=2127 RepID=UPI0006925896|nr:TatD family hydrolase [[Mycoplasma] collis]